MLRKIMAVSFIAWFAWSMTGWPATVLAQQQSVPDPKMPPMPSMEGPDPGGDMSKPVGQTKPPAALAVTTSKAAVPPTKTEPAKTTKPARAAKMAKAAKTSRAKGKAVVSRTVPGKTVRRAKTPVKKAATKARSKAKAKRR